MHFPVASINLLVNSLCFRQSTDSADSGDHPQIMHIIFPIVDAAPFELPGFHKSENQLLP